MLLSVSATAGQRTRFIAHRGESIIAPENTMAAFRAAIELGADGFEFDIYPTKDGNFICLHDSTVKRTGGVDERPINMTVAELKALDVGAWKGPQFRGERMPTLAEVLTLAHDDFELYVEIKGIPVPMLHKVAEIVKAESKATPERVLFHCFGTNAVAELRRLLPEYRAYWLTTSSKEDGTPNPPLDEIIATAKACNASGVNVKDTASIITPAFINAVKAEGLSMHVWWANWYPRTQELVAMGVDSIVSDPAAGCKLYAVNRPPALAVPAEQRTRFISHRGESLVTPENTMTAFRTAIATGADGLHVDVCLTKDNGIICLFDASTKRTTGVDMMARDATLAELQALDAGSSKGPRFKGERIPTLAETLTLARDGFEICVEVKCGPEIVPHLVKVIEAEPKATPGRVLFQCFNPAVITELRKQLPAYRAYWEAWTGPKKDGIPGPTAEKLIETAKACNASGIRVGDSVDITPAFINAIKDSGLSAHVWVINNIHRALELVEMGGVDTVLSDCAAALKLYAVKWRRNEE